MRKFEKIKSAFISVVTTSFVVMETATVLSHLDGQSLAKTFLTEVVERGRLPVIHITDKLQTKTLDIFKQQTKKKTSVVDCSNVAVMRQFDISTIFSFDKVYWKTFKLSVL